ncbi:MAG: hypothetical protein HYT46_01480 [Candidatus Vogelbacteria bacterium]|nr:hypothetical protein [Candidatus Vogelbacteria bacterium]
MLFEPSFAKLGDRNGQSGSDRIWTLRVAEGSWIMSAAEREIRDTLLAARVLQEDNSFNRNVIYTDPALIRTISINLAGRLMDNQIDVVVGPGTYGAILAVFVAADLSLLNRRKVRSAIVTKVGGTFEWQRGHGELVANQNVAVVADETVTGDTLRDVIRVVQSAQGKATAAAVICNCGDVTAEMIGAPLFSLVSLDLESHAESDCPLCRAPTPVNVW